MAMSAGKIGKYEWHFYQEAPSGKGKPLFEYQTATSPREDTYWFWIKNYELVVSRDRK